MNRKPSTMDLDEVIKALAHPVRREILQWLKAPEKHFADQEHPLEVGVCAGKFERCGLSQSTVSTHLAILQRAGLVTTRRIGQWVFYKRNDDTIDEFLRRIGTDL
ncbi:metalloregulator ArsR/SmtB family transcription factor [Azoarcus sp. L1K30]|uniref:ArsR/SmtB family transcription factor n=1 Tax=Azoarcus sp. L1K30 TaxID=2820277 RepID=UPI0024AF6E9D|nr:metalloregulator ArsR/SmtB family transcription factor [Azoarcus sp. L1K30]